MSPALRYSLARFGLLLGVFLLLLPIPGLSLLVKALLALLITMPLAWFLLRKWRDQASVALAEGVQRRRERRDRLRAALAGDDKPAEGQPVEGQPVEGQAAEGQAAEGQPVEGQAAEGQAAEGQAAEGQAVEGQAVEGQPAEDAPPPRPE